MVDVKLVSGWLMEYACAQRMTSVIHAFSKLDGLVDGGSLWAELLSQTPGPVPARMMLLTIETVMQQSNEDEYETILTLIDQLFVSASPHVPFKVYLKCTTGLKILTVFHHLRTKSKRVLWLLNQYFPASKGSFHPTAPEKTINKMEDAQLRFRKFFLPLIADADSRRKYMRKTYEEDFGSQFVLILQKHVRYLVGHMEKLLPMPMLMQLLANRNVLLRLSQTGSPALATLAEGLEGCSVLEEHSILHLLQNIIHPPTPSSGSSRSKEHGSSLDLWSSSGETNNQDVVTTAVSESVSQLNMMNDGIIQVAAMPKVTQVDTHTAVGHSAVKQHTAGEDPYDGITEDDDTDDEMEVVPTKSPNIVATATQMSILDEEETIPYTEKDFVEQEEPEMEAVRKMNTTHVTVMTDKRKMAKKTVDEVIGTDVVSILENNASKEKENKVGEEQATDIEKSTDKEKTTRKEKSLTEEKDKENIGNVIDEEYVILKENAKEKDNVRNEENTKDEETAKDEKIAKAQNTMIDDEDEKEETKAVNEEKGAAKEKEVIEATSSLAVSSSDDNSDDEVLSPSPQPLPPKHTMSLSRSFKRQTMIDNVSPARIQHSPTKQQTTPTKRPVDSIVGCDSPARSLRSSAKVPTSPATRLRAQTRPAKILQASPTRQIVSPGKRAASLMKGLRNFNEEFATLHKRCEKNLDSPSKQQASPAKLLTSSAKQGDNLSESHLTSRKPHSSPAKPHTSPVMVQHSPAKCQISPRSIYALRHSPAMLQSSPAMAQLNLSTAHLSPGKTQSSPIKQHTSPVKVRHSSTKKLTSPTKMQSRLRKIQCSPAQRIRTPAKQNTSVVKAQSSTTMTQASPRKRHTSPLNVKHSPAKQSTSLSKTQSSPANTLTTPRKRCISPMKARNSPAKQATNLAKAQNSPAKTLTTPRKGRISPMKVQRSPTKQNTSLEKPQNRKRHTSTMKTQNSPPKQATSLEKAQNSPAKTLTTPRKRCISPMKARNSPAKQATNLAKAQNSPAKTLTTPRKRRISPMKARNSPAKQATNLAKAQNSPAKTLTTPRKGHISPMKVQRSPTKENTSLKKTLNRKRHISPMKTQNSPPKQATSLAKAQNSPAKTLTTPRKRCISPMKAWNSHAKQATNLPKAQNSPAKTLTTPRKGHIRLMKVQRSPTKQNTSLEKTQNSPAKKQTTPKKQHISPMKLQRSPAKQNTSLVKTQNSPAKTQASLTKQHASPAKTQRSPQHLGQAAATQLPNVTIQQRTIPVKRTASTPMDHTNPAKRQAIPVKNQISPSETQASPVTRLRRLIRPSPVKAAGSPGKKLPSRHQGSSNATVDLADCQVKGSTCKRLLDVDATFPDLSKLDLPLAPFGSTRHSSILNMSPPGILNKRKKRFVTEESIHSSNCSFASCGEDSDDDFQSCEEDDADTEPSDRAARSKTANRRRPVTTPAAN